MKASSMSCWLAGLTSTAVASPLARAKINVCPAMHIFGARETTLPQGFGTTQVLIDLVQKAFPGTTAEQIIYPAAGGDQYGASVATGITAVIQQLNDFQAQCPDSIVIMHGYSQVWKSQT